MTTNTDVYALAGLALGFLIFDAVWHYIHTGDKPARMKAPHAVLS